MCFYALMDRRTYIRRMGIAAGLVVTGGVGHTKIWTGIGMDNVIISDEIREFTPSFAEQALDRIRRVAENAGTRVRFIVRDVGNRIHAFFLSFEKKGSGRLIPVLRNEWGDTLYIRHGGGSTIHDVAFEEGGDRLLNRAKKRVMRAWRSLRESLHREDPLMLGMEAVAVGVGIWIGIAIAKIALAILGFLFFYAFVVALVLGGIAVIDYFIEKRVSATERMTHTKYVFMEASKKIPILVTLLEG